MKLMKIIVSVDEETVKNVSGEDDLISAVRCEAGWMHDSGIFVEEVEEIIEEDEEPEKTATSGFLPEYLAAMSEATRKHLLEIEAKYGHEVFHKTPWYFNDSKSNVSVEVNNIHDVSGNPDLCHATIVGPVTVNGEVLTGEFIEEFVRFTPEPLYEVAGYSEPVVTSDDVGRICNDIEK